MAIEQILAKLEHRYPDLERVSDVVYRGVDLYEGRPYAVRYFDLGDNLVSTAGHLHEYQNGLLGISYFNSESKADLRWNYYLYFVISALHNGDAFLKAKASVESNREYARKVVVTENDLDTVLDDRRFGLESAAGLPPDALSIWTHILENHDLGFIVDESLQVPAIVRNIADGVRRPLLRVPATPDLNAAEKAASTEFLTSLAIHEFRKYPLQKTFDFGTVNLILGVNGVGKTSLLEAIEYLFCGKTRRAGAVLPRTSVSGVLAHSELTLQTKTTTSQATLRSRNLVWYGKSELRTLTLADSFSKFNFLDTDAAVRLTVEQSSERIIDDLAQLLLGAESAKALDRFDRVARQLQDNRKTLENDIAVRDLRRVDAVARIQQLRTAPRQSDSLFSDLLLALRGVGWIQAPTSKDQADRLSGPLQAALVNVGILRSVGDTVPDDLEGLETSIRALTEVESAIERLSNEDVARKQEETQTRVRLQALSKRLETIDALTPIVGSGVGELHRKRESLERGIGERSGILAEAEAAVSTLAPNKALRRMALSRALTEWTEQVRSADERTDAARTALTALEHTQNLLRSLQQRLRASAREIIEHTGDITHCPLCRTEYVEAELKKRFDETAQGVVTEESDRLRSELQAAEALHQERVTELRALRALGHYAQADAGKTLVDAAIRGVTKDREEVDTLQSELETARATLLVQETKGWTFERLVELASAAGIPESTITLDRLDSVRSAIRDEQKRLLDAVHKLEADGETARARVVEIGITYELTNPSAAQLARTVSERRRVAEDRRKAVVALRGELSLQRVSSATELELRLREAQNLAVGLRTSVAKEKQDSDVIVRESKSHEDAVAEIEGMRVKLKRVDSAETVIQDLLRQQSKRLLADAVLRENAAQIASTFAKIHAPNEFDLVVNGGLAIVRRGSGKVDLDEMSSGQRAAYALSLFLAMNERLRTGPKLLLFDDPVAHVDDINTLSLLDHLRDIALSEQRQIFFATADSKIAALFGRKFRFLGERFKQIELARE
jgi:ABC-type cobalamin/Fe3+-siderophores transport system ATPase subunit